MWLFDRQSPPQTGQRENGDLSPSVARLTRRHMVLAPLCLSACGFAPVYGPGGSGRKLQNRIAVAAPEDRNAFLLVRRLEERLGRANDPVYTLSLTLQTREEGLGIDADGTTNRFNLIGIAGYVLSDPSGADLASGVVNSFTGYSASGNTAVTLAAEADAQARLMTILADQITARLLAAPLPA